MQCTNQRKRGLRATLREVAAAARAGAQGRGFAVVADAVRTLASCAREAATRIQQLAGRLRASSREAVGTTRQNRAVVDTSVGEVALAGQRLAATTRAASTINA